MKERLFIRGTLADRITYYHLVVFAMALPFDRLYSELALISLTVHTLVHLRKENTSKVRPAALLMPAAIYLLTVLGTAYTQQFAEAVYEWERQLAILLFPLIVAVNGFDFRKYMFSILSWLAISCSLTILYLYYEAGMVIRYNHLPFASVFSNAFLNHNFSAPVDMHATYFSMYIALAALASLYALFQQKGLRQWIYAGMFLILVSGLLQLSSRAVLIAFAVVVNIVFPLLVFRNRKRVIYMLVSVLFSLSVMYALTRVDNLKTRFIIELKEDLTQAGVTNNALEPRIVRWKAAMELIRQSPVYGHGSGSEIALLKEVYFERKLYNSYISELNVHNQYLSMLIKTGVIGLVVLLCIFFSGWKIAVQSGDLFFCGFLVLVMVVSFSENILDANKGIFFFAFFYSLFTSSRYRTPYYSKMKLLQ